MICALWSLSWKLFRDWWIPFSRSHLVLSKSHHMLRVHWRNGWIESRDPRWDRVVLIRWRQRNPKYPLLRSRRRRRRRRCCCFPPLIIFTAPPPSIAFYTFLFVRSFSVSFLVGSAVLSQGSILEEVGGIPGAKLWRCERRRKCFGSELGGVWRCCE